MRATRFGTRLVGGLGFALVAALPASAQLANPSAAALGMGENYSAVARGYAATAWNPAMLGLSGNPGFSMNIASIRGIAGIDPITLADFKDYEGVVVPTATKNTWLGEIRSEGGEQGTSGFDGAWLALQFGRIGLQASSSGRALANISPGIAELIMFGNADENGTPKSVNLSGSTMDMAAYTTFGVSYAQPLSVGPTGKLSIGVTAKYTMGNFMMMGSESTGSTTASPIAVNMKFPIVHTPIEDDEGGFETNNGNGIGIDVGVGYELANGWTIGASVQNVINTFEWDQSLLRYREGELVFNDDTRETTFDSQSYSAAGAAVPGSMRSAIDDMKFKPVIGVGASGKLMPGLTAAADLRFSSAEGIRATDKMHAGAGLEYRLLSFLPLRAGISYVQIDEDNAGLMYSGGVGLSLGPLNLSASLAQRSTDLGKDTMFMVSLLSFGM